MAEAAIPRRPYTPELESRVDDDEDEDRDELGDDEKDRDTTAPSTPEPPTEVIRKCHPLLKPPLACVALGLNLYPTPRRGLPPASQIVPIAC